jgi:hypothetical protein
MEFLCHPDDLGVIPEPIPAGKKVPEWFKKIPPNLPLKGGRDHFGGAGMTAKKCLPMVDALTMGVIIPLYGDVNLRVNKDGSLIEASKNPYGGSIIEFHNADQLGGKSNGFKGPAIKFINRWIIKTAPGWSTLFVPCLNSLETRFTCLSALVDTDKYHKEVNFPAIWNVPDYDEVIPAGTPLVTAIPIKRSSMKPNVKPRAMTDKELKRKEQIAKIQQSRNHFYTGELRDRKEDK